MIPIENLQALPDKAIVQRLDNLIVDDNGLPSQIFSPSENSYVGSPKMLVVGGINFTTDQYNAIRLADNNALLVQDNNLSNLINRLTNYTGGNTNKNKYSDSNLADLEGIITDLTKDINDENGRIIATNIIPTSYALGSPTNYKIIITYYS